jgi:hypothetical protein
MKIVGTFAATTRLGINTELLLYKISETAIDMIRSYASVQEEPT